MRANVYTVYQGKITITVATPRADGTPSAKFACAKIQEDYCARVRSLLKEHRHVDSSSLEYPATKRLQTYFPTLETDATKPLYALRELRPIGSPRDFNLEFMLDVMRIQYAFTLNLLPAAFLADEVVSEAIERHIEYAIHQLFEANDVPNIFIPGDDGVRAGDRTDIDILCELGPADGRRPVDMPAPSQG